MDNRIPLEAASIFSRKIAKKYMPNSIILFGSYANGVPSAESDIDIAVVFDNFTDNWLRASTDIYGIGYDIDPRIETIVLDVSTANPSFTQDVLQNGKVLYQA